MPLKLYNTYSKTKEKFIPRQKGKVKIYVCGPTVYDYIHVGNARPFIVFDVLRRFLKYCGYDVTYIMNVTDIDDRIIEQSKREGIDTKEITEKYTKAFFEDIDALGIQRADVYPKASEHVHEMIELIKKLLDDKLAYQVGGNVFFNVNKFQNYGKLSGKKIDEQLAGARIAIDESKINPLDFALWKRKKPGEPAWDSPWGLGRPGWHIECSTMSMKYLGKSFDIHAGGVDLVFPHHENEIAQSEGATKQIFVKYWLHNGYLQIEGEKMAKSLGNFRTVREVLKSYFGVVIRMFFLQKHYRSPIDFTKEGLETAKSASNRLSIFFDNLNKALANYPISIVNMKKEDFSKSELGFLNYFKQKKKELIEAMEDDLNTPVALARLFEMVRETNKILSKAEIDENEKYLLALTKKEFEEINSFFGIVDFNDLKMDSDITNDLLNLLIQIRAELRNKKLWSLADEIRDELNKVGIILEDKSGKTYWRFK
ncbi:MAG: cysteine--tRNA ligase [bacterium]